VRKTDQLRIEFSGFSSLLKKEVLRFLKVGSQTILSPLVNAGLYLLVFGVNLANVVSPYPGVDYLSFLIPGMIALGAFNNSLQNSASSVMVSKFHGDLQDLRIIPLRSVFIASAYSIACLSRGLIVSVATFSIGQAFAYFQLGHFIWPAHFAAFIYFLCIGCFIFGNIGIWAGFITTSFDQINTITTFVVLPLIYLGGVFFSLHSMSPFWQQISALNPLVYLIQGLRWSMLDVSDLSIGVCALASLIFFVISATLAWYAVRFGSYQRF